MRTMDIHPEWIGHVNLNVRSRERAEAFYGGVLGMRSVMSMAQSPRQSGEPFAIEGDVTWNGVMLSYDLGLPGSGLDVLQWDPPLEDDDPRTHRVGLDEILFSAPDLGAVAERAREMGLGAEQVEHVDPDGTTETVLQLRDPDGTPVEVDSNSEEPRLRGVRINCTSLDDSADFYTSVCGLTALPRVTYSVGDRSYERQLFRYDGRNDTFRVELSQINPDDDMAPVLAVGNAIGIYRIAFMVASRDESLEWLRTNRWIDAKKAEIEIGTNTPTVHAAFFDDPDGTTVQWIEYGFLRGK